MTDLYKIIVTSKRCPAGDNSLKTKLADGSWEMVWHFANGSPMVFADRAKAETEAKYIPQPNNGITSARVEQWREEWQPKPLAG